MIYNRRNMRQSVAKTRAAMRAAQFEAEATAATRVLVAAAWADDCEDEIGAIALSLARELRAAKNLGAIESFLAEYGLSSREGVALLCLAEALPRVADAATADELIRDKIAAGEWARRLGKSPSSLVNASTWGLLLSGKIMRPESAADIFGALRALVNRLGAPVIRVCARRAVDALGRQFVLGETIEAARARAAPARKRGFAHSFDMLGEAAVTAKDAARYFDDYARAISALAADRGDGDAPPPDISVKLSALSPRYEYRRRARCRREIAPRLLALAKAAQAAGVTLNIDAEEADRLDLSFDFLRHLCDNLPPPADPTRADLGFVAQAYQKCALQTIDFLATLARARGRVFAVRLVKGAYWDFEIKNAQIFGAAQYPVFTRKESTDASFLACARALLDRADVLCPQFATHNARSAAAAVVLARRSRVAIELQRLYGMGEALHESLRARFGFAHRIYAPVGKRKDLLAYLARRMLENGANSSFAHQIVDRDLPLESILENPLAKLRRRVAQNAAAHPEIPLPRAIFLPARGNAVGVNCDNPAALDPFLRALRAREGIPRRARPLIDGRSGGGEESPVRDPADPARIVGHVAPAAPRDIEAALAAARRGARRWAATSAAARAEALSRAAELFEQNMPDFAALAVREAGKTIPDAVAEAREAVDFLRYYAARAIKIAPACRARGVAICVSPWNFPLAIFCGQVAAALAAGCAVVAKPAPQTPLIAARAVELLLTAGVTPDALHFLPGGDDVGAALFAAAEKPDVVCFTGSLATARKIQAAIAATRAPLIAETGGRNAMFVDSSALPEQAARDIVASAFQSAGQRCSALRVLCLQNEIADEICEMVAGAIDELIVGDPRRAQTDIGPVIDSESQATIERHIAAGQARGRLLHRGRAPARGWFVAPTMLALRDADELQTEVFGPVLHVARCAAADFEPLAARLHRRGGLTLGIHSRVDARVERIARAARVGNIYVNRNQIGAAVGVQPFGGEGESGTGPKAGGSIYLRRLTRVARRRARDDNGGGAAAGDFPPPDIAARAFDSHRRWDARAAAARLDAVSRALQAAPAAARRAAAAILREARAQAPPSPQELPAVAGESNRYRVCGRGVFWLPAARAFDSACALCALALAFGCAVVFDDDALAPIAARGREADSDFALWRNAAAASAAAPPPALAGILAADDSRVVFWRRRAASIEGAIRPVVADIDDWPALVVERVISINTAAAGGDADLLRRAG